MKRVNILIDSVIRWSAYKRDDEYQSWIDSCVAAGVWGSPGTYTIEVLDATEELETKRLQKESASKLDFNSHVDNSSNPHSVTKAQIGLDLVDNVSAIDLRDRATHTGVQTSVTISDFNEAAQDAVGNALVDSSNINFTYPDAQNQITADLSDTGVVAGTYSLVTVDSKGRISQGSNSGSITRYSYFSSSTAINSNATYTTVAELTSGSLPIGLYKISFFGRMQSGSTASGVGVRLSNGTATISTILCKWFLSQGANGTQQSFQYDQVATNTNVTSASTQAANSTFSVLGEGVIRLTSSGSVVIQIRSEVSGTSASLLADSFFTLELV